MNNLNFSRLIGLIFLIGRLIWIVKAEVTKLPTCTKAGTEINAETEFGTTSDRVITEATTNEVTITEITGIKTFNDEKITDSLEESDNESNDEDDNKEKTKTKTTTIRTTKIAIKTPKISKTTTTRKFSSTSIKKKDNDVQKNDLPNGYMLVDENMPNGPITIDREKDDGTKRNLYDFIRSDDINDHFDYNNFEKLNNFLPKQEEFICELKSKSRPEVLKGYDISCPEHYVIKIEKSFYGRYKKDKKHCIINNGVKYNRINIKKDCGYNTTTNIKELCEDKNYCAITVTHHQFKDKCPKISKYLHVEYQCIKEKKLKKERISIISFYNSVKVNSIEDHSISEFYQYSNIHGYDFTFEKFNYVAGREIYFVKIYNLIEKIIEGLKKNKYDWVVWVDSDILILNPNIKIETLLPSEKMKKVNLIVAYDYWGRKDICCGINAGVIIIRVCQWSLDMLMRTITYAYFNPEEELRLPEQISLNNNLIQKNETEHYIVVPPKWFNTRKIVKGSFLYHIMGGPSDEKLKIWHDFLNKNNNGKGWTDLTNKEFRKQVLDYYELPKEKQYQIRFQE